MVVQASGGDPGHLHDTLVSLRHQPSPEIEFLVAGSGAHLAAARAAAGDDTRARFVEAPGVPAALAAGLKRSRGRFVLVAAPGDRYPDGALADLLPVLVAGETLLLADQVEDGGPADLVLRPDLARLPYLGRLVTPREQILAALGSHHAPDPDGMPLALALIAAGVTVTPYRAHEDGRWNRPGPFVVQTNPLPRLAAQVERDRGTLAALVGADPAREQRALGALVRLQPFLEYAEAAGAADRQLLTAHTQSLLGLATDHLEDIDVVPRVLALLASAGRYDELVVLVGSRRFSDDLATTVTDGVVRADLGVALDPGVLVVGEHESRLSAQVRRLHLEGDSVVLEVLAGVRRVDQMSPPVVEARLVDGDRTVGLRVDVGADAAVTRWFAEPEHDHDHGLLTLRAPIASLSRGHWQLELDWVDGDLRRSGMATGIVSVGSAGRGELPMGGRADLTVRLRARHGRVAVEVAEAGDTAPAQDSLRRIEVLDDRLRLTTDTDIDAVWIEGNGHRVAGTSSTRGFWTIELADDRWGLGAGPLPSGGYQLRFGAAGRPVAVTPAPGLVDLLPAEHRTSLHRVQLLRADRGGLRIQLDPLLAEAEIGVRAQSRLQRGYAQVSEPLDPRLVYVQSFTGQWPGDHPLAIQAELVRQRPDLDVRWVVADSSATAPVGSTPLLFRSREWYDVLARASYLVTNIELERFFVRRAGQQILQTFHGYPSKAMGLGLWRARGLLPSQIEGQLDHTSRVWNNLLTPDPEMDQYYRRDYAYDGTILALGYPRNDVLVSSAAAELREATRARLGIAPGQRAVLYAPTWRDDLATNFRSAAAVHHLDVEQAAAALGDDYVLLLRGHRFHPPTPGGSRVIDVTAHPDINHLIAASDAAVLDYSSLRFDFALTGRPMVFLVPDLDTYGSRTRGFLWDYRETAPGPLVDTTAEVVAELRDLSRLAARYSEELVAFNARYNRLQDGRAAERVVAEFFAPLF